MGDYWVSSTDLGIKKKGLFTFLGTLYELWVQQGIRCAAQIVGRNIGATTERLCGSKESLGFSLNYGLRRRAEVL